MNVSLRTHVATLGLLLLPCLGLGAEASKFRFVASAYLDGQGRGMNGPEGVACRDDGTVVVGDTGNGRLLRYTFDGQQFRGGDEVRLPPGAYPTRVQFGPNGDLYCLDAKARRVLRAAAAGEASYIELVGVPEPSAVWVRSFRVDPDGSLYLLDPLGWRVLVVDKAGRFQRAIPIPEGVVSLDDLALDRGKVYLLDGVSGSVYSAAKTAGGFSLLAQGLRQFLNFTMDLTTDPRGGFYLTDQNGGGIVFLGPDGTFQARHSSAGWKEGLLRHPAQVCVTAKGEVVVADRDNSRIELFLSR